MSQSARLLEHFKQGNMINRLTDLSELGIFELSARVIDLEHLGYVIKRETYKALNRWGEPVHGKNYWLET